MLKKKATGGAAAAEPASPSKLARRGNGGSPPSLLLSTRSLPSLFSRDAPISPTSMGEPSKKSPCFGPRNGSCGASRGGGIGSKAAGLAAVLVAGAADGGYLKNGRVLLGMRLRVQLPPPPGKGPDDLPGSPIEFGVKNRDVQLALLSPVQRSPLSSAARAARRSEEEELSEDYTCVIARGPNPKMTHIFEDRVVESRAGAGAGDGDACCFLSSCCGCEEDALLLQRASGITSWGADFRIAFSLAEPPFISRLYAQLPSFPGPGKQVPFAVLASHRHLVLLRVGIQIPASGTLQDFFIFNASTIDNPSLLKPLPTCTEPLHDYTRRNGRLSRRRCPPAQEKGAPAKRRLLASRSMGLVSRCETDEFAVAELNLFKISHSKVYADICLLHSRTSSYAGPGRLGGEWNSMRQPTILLHNKPDDTLQLYVFKTDAVIAFNDRLCFIDPF